MFFKSRTVDEEIFVGFINEVGKLDIDGVQEYLNDHKDVKAILLARKELNDKVKEFFNELKKNYDVEFRQVSSFRKEIKKIKKEYESKKIKVQDMLEFGKRTLNKDVC